MILAFSVAPSGGQEHSDGSVVEAVAEAIDFGREHIDAMPLG